MSVSKICIAVYEGLNDPQQAAGGGLLRGRIVVAGVHRQRGVGIKDTRIEKCMPRVEILLRIAHSCVPSDMSCNMMKLPTVSGSAHPHSRKARGVSGGLHPHAENCRQSQALSTRAPEKRGASQAACTPMLKTADSLRLAARKLRDASGSAHPHMKIADGLRLCAPALTKMAGRLRRLACPW